MIFIDQGEEVGWQEGFIFAGGVFWSEEGFGQRGIFAGGGFGRRVFFFLPEGVLVGRGGFVRRGALSCSHWQQR